MDVFELQHILDVDKWTLSEKTGYDMCGHLYYCGFCNKQQLCPCANAKLKYDARQLQAKASDDSADQLESVEEIVENIPISKENREKGEKKKKIVRSHQEKYDMASDILKARYAELRDYMLSYKSVSARVSKRCDSYRAHCEFIARIFVTGKSLKIYLPLDPTDPDLGKYPHVDVSYKKTINETPFSFKVNSKLAVKRAKELISMVCEEKGLKRK